MKSLLVTLMLSIMILVSTNVLAEDPPVNITRDVHVVPNATPAQCPSSYRGIGGQEGVVNATGGGEADTLSGAGILSCTGCAIDPASRDCVCKTCYADFN